MNDPSVEGLQCEKSPSLCYGDGYLDGGMALFYICHPDVLRCLASLHPMKPVMETTTRMVAVFKVPMTSFPLFRKVSGEERAASTVPVWIPSATL